MKRHFPIASGIVLFVVFAFFFASTNLFTHTHDGPYGKIVHSHPWSGKAHSHSGTQLQLISLLSVGTYDAAPILDHIDNPSLPEIIPEACEREEIVSSHNAEVLCLRGPPMFS